MILTADYHTHTVFSHGKGQVIDNAYRAKEIGLMEIGITDHGFSHPAFGLRKRVLPKLLMHCEEASKATKINVLSGIESNIIGSDGTVDLKEEYYDYFDIFLAGVHKFVLYKPKTLFSLFVPNFFNSTFNIKDVPKWLIKENTKAYINVIKHNPVDVITHLNYCTFSDPVEVAKVASDYGTYIELNAKKVHLTDEQVSDMLVKTKVNFVIDSDAHSIDRIGEISLVQNMLDRIEFDRTRIHNIDGRLPLFRFSNFKETNQK